MEKHHAFWWAILVVAGLFTGLYGIELWELSQSTQLQLSSGGDSLTGFATSDGERLTGMAVTVAVDLSSGIEQTLDFKNTEKKSLSWDTGEDNYGMQEFDVKLVAVSGSTRVTINAGEKETVGKGYTIQSGSPLKLNFYGDNAEDLIITLISADKAKGTAKIKAAWLKPGEGAASPSPLNGITCPVSLSNYDVNKDGTVDETDLQNFVATNPTLTGKAGGCRACPREAGAVGGAAAPGGEAVPEEGEAVPAAETPACDTLTDCKLKEECKKKQLANGKLCIWSLVAGEKIVNDKRKGECSSLTACVNLEGKCTEQDVFYTNKYICGGNNEWIACGASNKEKPSLLGKYVCDGTKWKEKTAEEVKAQPKVDNPPVVQSLLSAFLGKKITVKEGDQYTSHVLAQDPDGDAITEFKIMQIIKDGKSLTIKNLPVIESPGKKETGTAWTKAAVTWTPSTGGTPSTAGIYQIAIKVTSGIKTAAKSTTVVDTITVEKKTAAIITVGGIGPSLPTGIPTLNACKNLADCKKNQECIDKKIDNGYCVWSAHPLDTNNMITRKGLCKLNTDCITANKECIKIGEDSGKYTCFVGNKWTNKLIPTLPSPSSIVKVDLAAASVTGKLNNGWLHIGDKALDDFNQKGYTTPEIVNKKLQFTLPYTIGDYSEIFLRVADVSNSPNYNTEIELNSKKDWPIDSLSDNIGKPLGGVGKGGSGGKYSGDYDGVAVQLFKNTDLDTKFADISNLKIPIKIDLGLEGNNYDDIEIKDFYVKTGIIFNGADKFGDKQTSKTYSFSSTYTGNIADKAKLRVYTTGLYKPTTSDVSSNQYITTLNLNNIQYILNDPSKMSVTYKEHDLKVPCLSLKKNYAKPDAGAVIELDIEVPLEDIKNTQGKQKSSDLNKLTITAGKKTTGGKTNYDDFIVGRIELVMNEDPKSTYSLSDASAPLTNCAK